MASMSFTPDSRKLVCATKKGHIVYVWNLPLVRAQLAAINLDWDLPPYAPAPSVGRSRPIDVVIDAGSADP